MMRIHCFLQPLAATLLALSSVATAAADQLAAPGESLVAIFAERDREALNRRLDVDALLARVLEGSNLGARDRRDFEAGFRGSMGDLTGNLMRDVEMYRAKPKLVKSTARPDGSTQVVRLDMYDENGDGSGHDYLEFELGKDGRIRDWRSHAQTGRVSDTIRLMTVGLLDTGSFAAMLFGRASVDEEGLADMARLVEATKRGDARAAHAALGEMPDYFRRTRQWAAMRVSYSADFDDDVYRE
ncbi:MAG TPA: hypothetical protein VFL14_08120, partial [Xanthomonadales bacterium]|nr:hypothetical protein [Xanthomonadales bacterium]